MLNLRWQSVLLALVFVSVCRSDCDLDACYDIPLSECNLEACSAITNIELSGRKLTGTIPATLGKLTQLEEIHLGGNSLTGTLPELSALKRLRRLHLHQNQLVGELPDFSPFPELSFVGLQFNAFSGAVPPSICSVLERTCVRHKLRLHCCY